MKKPKVPSDLSATSSLYTPGYYTSYQFFYGGRKSRKYMECKISLGLDKAVGFIYHSSIKDTIPMYGKLRILK